MLAGNGHESPMGSLLSGSLLLFEATALYDDPTEGMETHPRRAPGAPGLPPCATIGTSSWSDPAVRAGRGQGALARAGPCQSELGLPSRLTRGPWSHGGRREALSGSCRNSKGWPQLRR